MEVPISNRGHTSSRSSKAALTDRRHAGMRMRSSSGVGRLRGQGGDRGPDRLDVLDSFATGTLRDIAQHDSTARRTHG